VAPPLTKSVTHRDKSGGKRVGKEVNLLQRKMTKVISSHHDDDDEEADDDVDVSELLALELKRHKAKQQKYQFFMLRCIESHSNCYS
jgi:hypothetical protein